MPYQPFDENMPEGANTPPVYADTDLANVRALRDGIVSGFIPGWAFALSGAAGPVRDIYTWSKGVFRLRLSMIYTGSLITSMTWEWSDNSGGAYVNIGTGGTAAAVVSLASGIISTVDKDMSMAVLALSANQRAGASNSALNAHIAATGAAVHGLGTMSTQNANAVAITGGTVAGVAATGLTRLNHAAPPTLTSGAVFDWAARPTHVEMAAGGTITGLNNAVAGEMKRILVIGNGAITINAGAGNTLTYAVGHPVWGTNATIVNLIARSATLFYATTIPV